MRRRPHVRSLPATLPLILAGQAWAQSQQSFEPFDSIEGSLTAEVYYDTIDPASCTHNPGLPVEEGYITHTVPFGYYQSGTVGADAFERCSLYSGVSLISGAQFRDLVKSRPPDYITSGHEWTFEMTAEASSLGHAGVEIDIEFTLNRPVRVSMQSTHSGFYEARVGSLVTETYNPLDGDIIDYYHADSEVLGPGTHRLTAYAQKGNDRNTVLDAEATLWIRFDDAYCSPADLAEPFAMHDGSDIRAFIGLFLAQDLAADMNADGITDLADIEGFVGHFLGGCVNPAGEP